MLLVQQQINKPMTIPVSLDRATDILELNKQ